MTKRTYVMLKPDAVERKLVGRIISRFEDKNLVLIEMAKKIATKELLEEHYAEHAGKSFFTDLVKSMQDKQVICMIWENGTSEDTDLVALVRIMVGATNPLDRATGTIRGDFSCERTKNLIHASDSVLAVEREIAIWFQK